MLNPLGMQKYLKKALSAVMLVFFCTTFVPYSMAQSFDFSDSDDDMGDSFNFTDDEPEEFMPKEAFSIPETSNPISFVFFEPVDSTDKKHLDNLTDALVEHYSGEQFSDLAAVKAVPILDHLESLDESARFECVNGDTPKCLTDIAKEYNVDHIVIGRYYGDSDSRPMISLDLIDVKSNANTNFVQFETQSRLRRQEKDLGSALANLFNKEMPAIDTLLGTGIQEESNPLPTGQLVSGIVLGVLALSAIGVGIKFGLDAKDFDDKLKKGISANREAEAIYGQVMSQSEAKKYADDASKSAMIANVLYASGAVLGVVSAILFLVRPEPNEDFFGTNHDIFVSPNVGEDGSGVVAGFKF